MKRKTLWRISVATTPEAEEAVQELLAETFAAAVAVYTDAETRRTDVAAYLDSKPDRAAIRTLRAGLDRIKRCGLKPGTAAIALAKVRREDWANSWKRHFHPITIGDALLVKPSWDRTAPKNGQKLVILDPGLSFGTGQHPTTAFCLEQLAARRRAGVQQRFLDAGTGSGILAIAAAKLAYARVYAFDFDPEAVRVAKANAAKNRVTGKIQFAQKDLTKLPLRSCQKYDVICANLISSLLIAEQRRLLNRLSPDGTLIVAGILAVEFLTIKNAYESAGLGLTNTRQEGEWQSGAFVWKPE